MGDHVIYHGDPSQTNNLVNNIFCDEPCSVLFKWKLLTVKRILSKDVIGRTHNETPFTQNFRIRDYKRTRELLDYCMKSNNKGWGSLGYIVDQYGREHQIFPFRGPLNMKFTKSNAILIHQYLSHAINTENVILILSHGSNVDSDMIYGLLHVVKKNIQILTVGDSFFKCMRKGNRRVNMNSIRTKINNVHI